MNRCDDRARALVAMNSENGVRSHYTVSELIKYCVPGIGEFSSIVSPEFSSLYPLSDRGIHATTIILNSSVIPFQQAGKEEEVLKTEIFLI
jgi:hypothetical protein